MNKVLISSFVFGLLLVSAPAPVGAQVIGGTGGATGQIDENSSSASSFQQAPNQNQPSSNTAQNTSNSPLFEELANTKLTVTGAAPSIANTATTEKKTNVLLVLFLTGLSAVVLLALYKLNKDGMFDRNDTKDKEQITPKAAKSTPAATKSAKKKTQAPKKKRSKKHHR